MQRSFYLYEILWKHANIQNQNKWNNNILYLKIWDENVHLYQLKYVFVNNGCHHKMLSLFEDYEKSSIFLKFHETMVTKQWLHTYNSNEMWEKMHSFQTTKCH